MKINNNNNNNNNNKRICIERFTESSIIGAGKSLWAEKEQSLKQMS